MESFGTHLKRIRESRGMTVNQLAMYSGISSASVSRYESGERNAPKPENIKKLAEALKYPYEELMTLAGHLKATEEKKTSFLTDPQKLELYEAIEGSSKETQKIILDLVKRLNQSES
jgi:transcriptional regulator with XRE-family HTH domain